MISEQIESPIKLEKHLIPVNTVHIENDEIIDIDDDSDYECKS